jgi:diguanylate cyclase (GGDEF)-like protein/PAS domain S-box-containing protein
MNQVVIFSAIPAFFCLCLCLTVLISSRRHEWGKLYVFLCLDLFLLSLLNLYFAAFPFNAHNHYFFACLALAWALLPALLLHCCLRVSEVDFRFQRMAEFLFYAPVVFFVYRGWENKLSAPGIDNRLLEWSFGPGLNEWWSLIFVAYFCLYLAASATLLYVSGRNFAGRDRKTLICVAAGAVPVAGYVLVTDILLYDLLRNYSVTAALLITVIWVSVIWAYAPTVKRRLPYQFSSDHIFENLFSSMTDLILVTDNSGRILRANKSLLNVLGYEEEEIAGKDISNLIVEAEFILKTFVIMRHGVSEGEEVTVHFRSKKGEQIPLNLSSLPFGDGEVKLRGIIMIARYDTPGYRIGAESPDAAVNDAPVVSGLASKVLYTETPALDTSGAKPGIEQPIATSIGLGQNRLSYAEDHGFRNLVEHALIGIFMTLNGRLVYVNKKMAEIFGYKQDEISGSMHVLELVEEDDRKGVADRIDKVIRTGKKSSHFTFRGKQKEGDTIDIEAQGLMGEFYGEQVFIGSLYEITERKMLEEAMRHEALHDPLTSLPNRILFCDRLDMALAKAEREKALVGVMFLDLDRFKNINDTFGHNIGDMLLQSAAGVLSGCLRESDSVARLGGDEFTVMLSCIHTEEDAVTVARKILAAVNQKWFIAGHRLNITTSVGISMYPNDGSDSETLIRKADTAMYSAKAHGGNNIRFYSPVMDASDTEQIRMENDLRVALDKEELFIHYQPLFDMTSKRILGVEAFMRWNHPECGVLMPDKFLPIAEKTGIIVAIGEWALNVSCSQVKKWHDKGYPSLDLAIHISGVQLKEADFVDMVEGILKKTSFDPKRLKLEITENVALQNLEAITPKLVRLSNLGVQFAVDDFGMGYSSLHYLKRLPIKTVKIDKSFTRNLSNSEEDASIITAVIAMAKSLQLDTIAEGVETREQAAFLSKCRCDSMQGYMYSRPLSPEAFEMFIR